MPPAPVAISTEAAIRDIETADLLRAQIRDCDERMKTLIGERGRIADALMEIMFRQHYGSRLHAKHENRDRGWRRDGNPKPALAVARGVMPCLLALLLASPASAQSPMLDRAVDLANGSAIVAHAADLTSTTFCLAALTCKEANPLLVPHVSSPVKFFALKMGVAMGSYAVKSFTKKRYPWQTLAFAVAENVAFFWIAARNADVHRKALR
jgi:hypothetical protein